MTTEHPARTDLITNIITVSLLARDNSIVHEFVAESIAPFSGNVLNIRYPDGKIDLYHVPEGWALALTDGLKDAVA